jgi:hypothetical protein
MSAEDFIVSGTLILIKQFFPDMSAEDFIVSGTNRKLEFARRNFKQENSAR